VLPISFPVSSVPIVPRRMRNSQDQRRHGAQLASHRGSRLVVWKNKTAITIGILDITNATRDELLEAAREKLANIALARIS
jgi:hypothetical protein